jgi:hypothetical protein
VGVVGPARALEERLYGLLWPMDAPRDDVPWRRHEAGPDVTWQDRARQREREGLPSDRETVEALISESPWVFTADEERDLVAGGELADRAQAVFDDDPDAFGRLEMCWKGGRRAVLIAVTRDVERYRAVLEERFGADRVTVTTARFSGRQVRALQERIVADNEQLLTLGIDYMVLSPDADNCVRIEYCSADKKGSERILRQRYGSAVEPVWIAPTRVHEEPHPFKSWAAKGRKLTVFYGLQLDEEPGNCVAEEHPDRVVVHLTLRAPHGPRPLVFSYRPSSATVTLAAPLADRAVIDGTTGEKRPKGRPIRQDPKFRRPGEQAVVVRLFVPDDDPLEVELNMDPQTFRGAMEMEAEAENGLLIAQDREGKWWFCPYRSIHSWDVLG